jgi:hypothetical protein
MVPVLRTQEEEVAGDGGVMRERVRRASRGLTLGHPCIFYLSDLGPGMYS